MAFRATLSVVLGCNFGSAARLLAAAEAGQEQVVAQVLRDKPQLAAFSGFHGTTSPLHRAAAAGHLGVCRAIIEPLKARIRAAEAATGGPGSPRAAGAGTKWRRLLATVLNQRSHKSLTPLMLACEHGHATVAAYLLREGADPLASDFVHSRTCLHYAAVGGHADCLRLLCSDAAMVPCPEGARPLRDVIVSDLQVQACRFIDQRAFGGLTALHFAVATWMRCRRCCVPARPSWSSQTARRTLGRTTWCPAPRRCTWQSSSTTSQSCTPSSRRTWR
jgi:ankyrin repeat protein